MLDLDLERWASVFSPRRWIKIYWVSTGVLVI